MVAFFISLSNLDFEKSIHNSARRIEFKEICTILSVQKFTANLHCICLSIP